MRTDNLCITCHIQLIGFLLAIDDGHDCFTLILACDDIHTLIRTELSLLAFGNHLVTLAPMQQVAEPLEHPVLILCSSCFGEGIMLVASPSTWEVFTHVAVGYTLGAIHQHFCTIIELRCTVNGKQERQSLLQCHGILALAEESVSIVIFNECHHALWVRIEIIVAEHIIETVHSVPPVIGFLVLGTVDTVEEGKIHHCFQIAVLL